MDVNTNGYNAPMIQEEEDSIDLLELLAVIWSKIWAVVIGLLAGGAVAFLVTSFLMTPVYQAKSIIYIFSKSTSISSLADLQIGSQLTEDYRIIATTRSVINEVIDELKLDTTYESLVSQIKVTNPDSSHMLYVTVSNPDPEMAAKICNALSEKMRDQIADVVNTDRPSMVERAVVPKNPTSPSLKKNVAIGALGGAVVVIAVIILGYMLDDTIKTSDDVEKYLGLDTLASFPLMHEKETDKKKGGKDKDKDKTGPYVSY